MKALTNKLIVYLASREVEDDEEFRLFKKQLYHASLAKIFEPLRAGMTTLVVMLCPDGHYRRVIFELGPFIAYYPEQVILAGILQGWWPTYSRADTQHTCYGEVLRYLCYRCLAPNDDLDTIGNPRSRELTCILRDHFEDDVLWEAFGVVSGVVVRFKIMQGHVNVHTVAYMI